jgi:hypothetical protein
MSTYTRIALRLQTQVMIRNGSVNYSHLILMAVQMH